MTETRISAADAKARSYEVRRELLDLLGQPENSSPRIPANWLVDVVVDGVETDAVLLWTTNAGFRGIEGTFRLADGRRLTMSLGYVTCVAA